MEALFPNFLRQPPDEERRGLVINPLAGGDQRDGYRRYPHESRFHRRGNGARIRDVVTHIASPVDPRDHQIGTKVEKVVDAEIDTVGGGAADSENIIALLLGPERVMERNGMADRTLLTIRGDNRHPSQTAECRRKRDKSRSSNAVVIGNHDVHGNSVRTVVD